MPHFLLNRIQSQGIAIHTVHAHGLFNGLGHLGLFNGLGHLDSKLFDSSPIPGFTKLRENATPLPQRFLGSPRKCRLFNDLMSYSIFCNFNRVRLQRNPVGTFQRIRNIHPLVDFLILTSILARNPAVLRTSPESMTAHFPVETFLQSQRCFSLRWATSSSTSRSSHPPHRLENMYSQQFLSVAIAAAANMKFKIILNIQMNPTSDWGWNQYAESMTAHLRIGTSSEDDF